MQGAGKPSRPVQEELLPFGSEPCFASALSRWVHDLALSGCHWLSVCLFASATSLCGLRDRRGCSHSARSCSSMDVMPSAFCSLLHPSLLPHPAAAAPVCAGGLAMALTPWCGLCCPLSPSCEQGHGCRQDFGIELAFLSAPTTHVGL